jgi:hypothetical protein
MSEIDNIFESHQRRMNDAFYRAQCEEYEKGFDKGYISALKHILIDIGKFHVCDLLTEDKKENIKTVLLEVRYHVEKMMESK